jgi:hypothetical protein
MPVGIVDALWGKLTTARWKSLIVPSQIPVGQLPRGPDLDTADVTGYDPSGRVLNVFDLCTYDRGRPRHECSRACSRATDS